MSYMRIYLNDVLMDQVELNKDQMTIGRSTDSDIVLDNAGVSSKHARVEKAGGGFVIADNDSSNGVFVNGRKIDEHRLEYRDEIQIYNYVLKYMASRGLHGLADPDIAQDGTLSQTGTMEVDISDVKQLLELREKKKTAYLEIVDGKGNQSRFKLKEQSVRIGRSKACDIRIPGWLCFGLAAEIQRGTDGYRLVPQGRARVTRNDEPVTQPVKLMDGDYLRIKNLNLRFFHRVISDR